jgi:catechol 2,3-dioxygenase-like lactoylglutathione lyase family enzyme
MGVAMLNKLAHVGLVVRDLENSIAFYEGLGLVLWKRMMREGAYMDKLVGIPGVVLEWAKMHAPDGSEVELIQYHHPADVDDLLDAPSNRLGCSHVAFVVDDLSKACSCIVPLGGSIVNPPTAESRSVYCHDLDGIIVELVCNV